MYLKNTVACTFTAIDIEQSQYGIFVDTGCADNSWFGGYVDTVGNSNADIGVYLQGTSNRRNRFEAMLISGETDYSDTTTGSNYRNVLRDCEIGVPNINLGTQTLIFNCQQYCTEFVGSHASTVDAHTITHGLDAAPTYLGIEIAFTSGGQLMTVGAYNVGASTFQIYLYWNNGTAVDVNHSPQTITWRAIYQPNGNVGFAG
jgi:hypothetical protein